MASMTTGIPSAGQLQVAMLDMTSTNKMAYYKIVNKRSKFKLHVSHK